MRIQTHLLITVLLGVMCSAGTAAEGRKMPILSCETYSFRDLMNSGKLDYLTVPKLLKDLGIPGITYNSIWMKSYDKPYLDSIKKACKDAGVKITGFIIEGNVATLDDEARKKQIEEDIKQLKGAAYLGAPVVRINLGGTGKGQEVDDTVGVERVIDAFNQILPIAKQLGVKITIENHGGVSKNADAILKVIKGTDPAWVGACLDFGNWPPEARNRESAKLAAYAYHVHAKCREFAPDGEAVGMDYKYLLGLLKRAHYTGAVSIEYEGGGDQIEGVKKTAALIRKYWPEL